MKENPHFAPSTQSIIFPAGRLSPALGECMSSGPEGWLGQPGALAGVGWGLCPGVRQGSLCPVAPVMRGMAPEARLLSLLPPCGPGPACQASMREVGPFHGVGSQTEFALTWDQPPLVTFSDTFSVAASVFPWRRGDEVREGKRGSFQNLPGERRQGPDFRRGSRASFMQFIGEVTPAARDPDVPAAGQLHLCVLQFPHLGKDSVNRPCFVHVVRVE